MSTAAAPRTPLPTPPGWAELAREPRALFLDVDGTLLEFEEHPDLVRATEGLVSLLRGAEDALAGALAVISGRPLHDLDRVFSPWRPLGAGIHGAEVRSRSGERRHLPDEATMQQLRREVHDIVARTPGCWVEDKGASLAVHHRDAPDAGDALVERFATLASPATGLVVLRGVLVVELRPGGHDKGTAVDELMTAAPFAGRAPVVIGDDTTDEDAFRAAKHLGGLAVVAGPREDTVATHRLADPAAVRGWLAELVEEVRT